jgi:hypothetical protein
MLRRTLLAAAVSPALLAGAGSAFAQAVVIETPAPDVYVVPTSPPAHTYYYRYEAAPPPPPVVRYYRYDPDEEVVVVRPRVRAACGPSAYWDGRACVYARW